MKNLFASTPRLLCAPLLGLAFSLALTTPAQAQPGLRVGLKTGLNLATYTGRGSLSGQTNWQPGYATGLLLAYPLSRRSALQVEALYSQKGTHQHHYRHTYRDPAFQSHDNFYRATLAYLDVPVLYTFGPGSTGRGLYAEVGPQLSLALGKREFVRPTAEGANRVHEETLSTDRRTMLPVGAGYVAGIGYQLANGLGAGIRYSGDFTNVYRSGYGSGSYNPGSSNPVRNGVFQLQVSFLFGRKCSAASPVAESRRPQPARHPEPELTTPPPTYLDSLYQDPKVRRVLKVITFLSWLNSHADSQPVHTPRPASPRIGRRGASTQPQPQPQPQPHPKWKQPVGQ